MPKGTGYRGIDDKVRTLDEAKAAMTLGLIQEIQTLLAHEPEDIDEVWPLSFGNVKIIMGHIDTQAAKIADLKADLADARAALKSAEAK